MTAGAQGLRAQKYTHPDSDNDPYCELVKAILHRAMEDAQGRCVHPGDRSSVQIEVEARAWLADGAALAALVELAGYDAAPVLMRVRRLLAPDRRETP
jgi:hypothetical protein